MNNNKEKDRILAEIKAFKKPCKIADLSKYLFDLERDGYVKVWRNEQSHPITVRLTPQGNAFLESGGYANIDRKYRNGCSRKLIVIVLSWIFGIVATVIGGWIVWKLTSSTEGL